MKIVDSDKRLEKMEEYLLGEYAGFITCTDLLIDGGVIAAMKSGKYSLGM